MPKNNHEHNHQDHYKVLKHNNVANNKTYSYHTNYNHRNDQDGDNHHHHSNDYHNNIQMGSHAVDG